MDLEETDGIIEGQQGGRSSPGIATARPRPRPRGPRVTCRGKRSSVVIGIGVEIGGGTSRSCSVETRPMREPFRSYRLRARGYAGIVGAEGRRWARTGSGICVDVGIWVGGRGVQAGMRYRVQGV